MDRAVPRTGSEEIELYVRTYYSLLRSTAEIQIRTLEEVHAEMASSLHVNARSPQPDMPAFIYNNLPLPSPPPRDPPPPRARHAGLHLQQPATACLHRRRRPRHPRAERGSLPTTGGGRRSGVAARRRPGAGGPLPPRRG